jgi:hypothetical protein
MILAGQRCEFLEQAFVLSGFRQNPCSQTGHDWDFAGLSSVR